jgi:hypothetical protein
MAGAASSIGSIAQLNKSQQTHSLFHHGKKAAKAGKALGNQQQFATLLAAKQTSLSTAAAGKAITPVANGGNATSTTSTVSAATSSSPAAQTGNFSALLAG